jgi:type I restriction enzyme S subunit
VVEPVSAQEEPYSLPEGWTWARFNDVATIVSDRVDPKNHPDKPHVSPASVEKKTGVLLGYNTIKEDGVTSSKSRFQPGQIVYSKIRPNLSKAIIADFEGLCSADMYPIRSHINTSYLHYYMLSGPFTAQVTDDDNRVAMPKTNQSELRRVAVALPPSGEQQRITESIDRLLPLCDDLEDLLSKTDERGEQLLQAALRNAGADQQDAVATGVTA